MLLTCSHISEEMVSRTERAFSRASRRHDAIEFGFSRSKARNSMTLRLRGLAVPLLEDLGVAAGVDQRLPLLRRRQRQVELQVAG